MRLIFFVLIIVLISCHQKQMVIMPAAYKDAASSLLETKAGIAYCDGKIFTGNIFLLNERKDTIMLSSFLNGKLDGAERKWYGKDRLMEERFYANGEKEKTHKGYWENGQLKFEYHFSDDEYEGMQKEWYADGKVFRLMNYEKGHEIGMQKMYRNDGSYVFNYEVKNGRMYGLTGTKNCKNVGETITKN